MKCLVLCMIVLLCGISGRNSTPQGFFGGLLPTASPQGGSPPKGPFGIFTQGQQNAQNPVGGFISTLVDTRDKIRNETKKRIQSLLNATMGNRNKVDPELTSEKPEEPPKPEEPAKPEEATNQHKGDKEVLPEKPEQTSLDNKKKESDSSPEKQKQPENANEKESDIDLEKLKQLEGNYKKESPEKAKAPSKPTKLEATTVSSADVDKLIEDVFSDADFPTDDMKEETPDEPAKTPETTKEEDKKGSGKETI